MHTSYTSRNKVHDILKIKGQDISFGIPESPSISARSDFFAYSFLKHQAIFLLVFLDHVFLSAENMKLD
jgi:hypothetical protein